MEEPRQTYSRVQEAIAFATRAHRHQIRKDNLTPYVSHVFRVCLTVRHLFGIEDEDVLIAAVLHDTIEDTTTDYDDLEERFGMEVADWVSNLSKDKRLRDGEREKLYRAKLAEAPWQVQVCKLADVYDNLCDSGLLPPEGRKKALKRSRKYLAALESELKEQARRPFEIVSQLLTELED